MRRGLRGFVIAMCVLAFLVLGAWLPNRAHRPVNEAYRQSLSAAQYTSDTSAQAAVRYVDDNVEAMELRLAMIEAAREEIILSTFDFNADVAGKQLLAALLHAAERGVEVRVIVDGLSGWLDLNGSGWFQALANCANAAIKIYNPLNPLLPWQAMCRLHDKYLIVDREIYLLGGRNSTDLFLGDQAGAAENLDSEVYVAGGDSVTELTGYFERVWALPESQDYLGAGRERGARRQPELEALYETLPERYPAAFAPDYLEKLETVPAGQITLLSNPIEAENKAPELWEAMVALMEQGEDVVIHTPYVILSREMEQDLTRVGERTQSLALILNDVSSGANPWGCVDYLNEKEHILATGATVGEYLGEHSMHTKNVLIDDRLCLVGSFNFDMRSAYLDTELMLVIDSPALNAQLRQKAAEELEYCRVVSALSPKSR